MEQEKKKNKIWTKIFSGSGWVLFTMFVWELMEEGLENLIAYALSSAIAIFAAKALSTLAIISATQLAKVSIKRFLMPFIKTLTYKEGKDKMNFLKKIFSFINANKLTLLSVIVGGSASFVGTYYLVLTYLIVPMWAVYAIASAVAIFLGGLSIYIGGDTIASYSKKISVSRLSSDDKIKVNNVIDTIVNAAAKAKEELKKKEAEEKIRLAEQAKFEAEKKRALEFAAKKEAEEKAKAEREAEIAHLLALAEQVKAEEEAKKKAETATPETLETK